MPIGLRRLRGSFHRSSSETRDFAERAFKRSGSNAPAPMLAVNEEAGDPPIRRNGQTFEISALVLDAWKLVG